MTNFSFNRIMVAFLIGMLFGVSSYAQRKQHKTSTPPVSIASQYADSLAQYRHMLDSVMAVNDSLKDMHETQIKSQYFKVFSPMTFDRSVMDNSFRLGSKDSGVVQLALLHLYLSRPDLLSFRKHQVDAAMLGTVENVPERIEMVKQVKTKKEPIAVSATDVTDGPLDLYVSKPNFWKFNGDYYLQFMQTNVSENWYKSGSNSYSMLGQVTLQCNYNNKQKFKWENKLEMKLGFQASESDTVNNFKSSEDLLRYTTKVGLQAHKNWYYTMQLVANTQFTQGKKDNQTKVYSDFMSPFNLNVSLGMDYTVATNNKKLTGNVHLAPLAFNFRYVDRRDLTGNFGIRNGHRTLEDFGSNYTIELTWKPSDAFKWQTRLYGYTTYHKYEMEWENTMSLKFNKYISAVLFLYPRFDDGVARKDGKSYLQFKEYLSFGFSYSM